MGQRWSGQQNGERADGPIEPVGLHGRNDEVFLGAHQRRDGVLEIIYERMERGRSVWHVRSGMPSIVGLEEACSRAINAQDPLGTLYATLSEAGIVLECVEDRFLR